MTGRGDIAVDVDHPAIGREAELPFVGGLSRFGVTEIGRERGGTSIDLWFLRELQELALDPEGAEAGERMFKSVDTCAAEFAARTPYYYSARERPAAAARPAETRSSAASARAS